MLDTPAKRPALYLGVSAVHARERGLHNSVASHPIPFQRLRQKPTDSTTEAQVHTCSAVDAMLVQVHT